MIGFLLHTAYYYLTKVFFLYKLNYIAMYIYNALIVSLNLNRNEFVMIAKNS